MRCCMLCKDAGFQTQQNSSKLSNYTEPNYPCLPQRCLCMVWRDVSNICSFSHTSLHLLTNSTPSGVPWDDPKYPGLEAGSTAPPDPTAVPLHSSKDRSLPKQGEGPKEQRHAQDLGQGHPPEKPSCQLESTRMRLENQGPKNSKYLSLDEFADSLTQNL